MEDQQVALKHNSKIDEKKFTSYGFGFRKTINCSVKLTDLLRHIDAIDGGTHNATGITGSLGTGIQTLYLHMLQCIGLARNAHG
jgi:hypothetical protein